MCMQAASHDEQHALRPVQQLAWVPAIEPTAELIGSAVTPQHPLLHMLRQQYGLDGSRSTTSSRGSGGGSSSEPAISLSWENISKQEGQGEGKVARPGRRLTGLLIRPRPPSPPQPPSPPPPPPPPPVPPAPECACQMYQDYVFASVSNGGLGSGGAWSGLGAVREPCCKDGSTPI